MDEEQEQTPDTEPPADAGGDVETEDGKDEDDEDD
jgi:hypothetical protein